MEMKDDLLSRRQEQVTQQQLYFSLVNKIQDGVRKNDALNHKIEKLENKNNF